jgi:hypothetical protein
MSTEHSCSIRVPQFSNSQLLIIYRSPNRRPAPLPSLTSLISPSITLVSFSITFFVFYSFFEIILHWICFFFFSIPALESRTTILKSAKGPISVAECDTQGRFILIENTSRSKSITLAGWTLRQESDQGDLLTFTFPENCLLRPNHSLKVNFDLTSIRIYASLKGLHQVQ